MSELLRQRVDEGPFRDASDEQALLRLTLDNVAWDHTAIPRSEGGQAQVYIAEREGKRPRAWRVTDIADPDARRRFMRVCAALKQLDEQTSNMEGDKHLPKVRQVGFKQDDPNRGVLVYDWIQGEPLDTQIKTLPVLARVFVIKQVALALDALHRRNVVHRDVHPRNIIIDDR
ncbi:protein kinase, partial [Dokdonella sp.]|uniref:protein kinase domain-containing protein n=1 Tax=Dokdonella sp. TaxID=2291710 RepID=UPI002DD65EBB